MVKEMHSQNMTKTEKQAVLTLSSIMSLRMIGLFMVLPVFTLYASQLKGATPALIGLSMGIYGLFQALFQIPFGVCSDRFGRKPIILIGFLIFAAGCLIAGMAHSITLMIIGRALQGMGAVGSTILAMMADLTREEQRTKSMAIAGITIGFSFSIAMLLGPLLTRWLPANDLFFIGILFSMMALFILYTLTPTPEVRRFHRDTSPELKSFIHLLTAKELAKLNSGIFILHAVFTASFIAIPISFYQFAHVEAKNQWVLYLPTLLIAAIISLFCIGLAERKHQIKPYFLGGIITILIAQYLLWMAPGHLLIAAIGLCLFFSGFSLLEAFLPSLISRTAPAALKGSAMGLYSCSQFLGIFVGGVLGGWLYGQFSLLGVYLFCIVLTFFWLLLALKMQPPRMLITHMFRLSSKHPHFESILAKFKVIPGMLEVTFIAEDDRVYLKMERAVKQHPDFIHLKEQLQSK